MELDLALGELAGRYMDMVFRIAFNCLKSRADSEDVTQDVMVKLCRAAKAFESEAHVKNWLIRVTVNECKKAAMSAWRKRIIPFDDYENVLPFETPEQSGLYDAVMALPAKYRIVVYLYYYEDYSVAEISGAIGVSETAVQTRLMRARAKLREKLSGGWHND